MPHLLKIEELPSQTYFSDTFKTPTKLKKEKRKRKVQNAEKRENEKGGREKRKKGGHGEK